MTESDLIVGQRISKIRLMTDAELEVEGWEDAPSYHRPVVLVLENGDRLYASQDAEGNGPGALFGFVEGKAIRVTAAGGR